MRVSEEALLNSGFSHAELQKIKNNVESHGGSIADAIQDLANRFRIVLWVFYGCVAIFLWVVFSTDRGYIIATGAGLAITMMIVIFTQPPVLSYKSWRYWKTNRS
nr:hypothetical protein [Erwinia sp. Ejp617]